MNKRKVVLCSITVMAISIISLHVMNVFAAQWTRADATVNYNGSKMIACNVDQKYFLSTTPYSISESQGIYMLNNVKIRIPDTNNFKEVGHWYLTMNETNHRYFRDYSLEGSGYNSGFLRSINKNGTPNSTITAKFGINDPWNA